MSAESLDEQLRALVHEFRAGKVRALARAITRVENEEPGFEALLDVLHDGVGRARRIGLTGPPGAGKSTLTARLARFYRDRGLQVGVIAVDPTSPFTGGALLGDRIRMNELTTEPGTFIRSMASRGSPGGLAAAVCEAADLMDAFGFERILLETVGVGQSELEIAASADTTVLILVPESGDGIQTMKAGLMEVADVFVVNKADRPGAEGLCQELEIMKSLHLGAALRGVPTHHGVALSNPERTGRRRNDRAPRPVAPVKRGGRQQSTHPEGIHGPSHTTRAWDAPVLQTVATTGRGVEALATALDAHFQHLQSSGALEARRSLALLEQVRAVLVRKLEKRAEGRLRECLPAEMDGLDARTLSPYELARRLYRDLVDEGDVE